MYKLRIRCASYKVSACKAGDSRRISIDTESRKGKKIIHPESRKISLADVQIEIQRHSGQGKKHHSRPRSQALFSLSISDASEIDPPVTVMILQTLSIALAGFYLVSLVSSTACTVCNSPGFGNLRPCVAACIGCAGAFTDEVGVGIGCGRNAPNECWYRTDLFTLATSAISACASSHCTSIPGGWQNDYSGAESVYQNYCLGAGYTAAPAVNAANPTVDPNAPTVTQVTFVTQTSTSSASGSASIGSKFVFSTWILWNFIYFLCWLLGGSRTTSSLCRNPIA
jgi:hypothetical protein